MRDAVFQLVTKLAATWRALSGFEAQSYMVVGSESGPKMRLSSVATKRRGSNACETERGFAPSIAVRNRCSRPPETAEFSVRHLWRTSLAPSSDRTRSGRSPSVVRLRSRLVDCCDTQADSPQLVTSEPVFFAMREAMVFFVPRSSSPGDRAA